MPPGSVPESLSWGRTAWRWVALHGALSLGRGRGRLARAVLLDVLLRLRRNGVGARRDEGHDGVDDLVLGVAERFGEEPVEARRQGLEDLLHRAQRGGDLLDHRPGCG